MRHAPRLFLLAALASTPLHAQAIVSNGTDGNCTCVHGAKSWPCRYARGFSLNAINQCNANASYRLVCPEDPKAICHYVLEPAVCTEQPVTPVCYAADEPK